jgi:DNA-binding NtrC family response regulator
VLIDDDRLEIDIAEIKIVSGPDKGLKLALPAESFVIGSGSSCTLVLHDPTVSARHAEVELTSSGYVIRDLGSTNGLIAGTQRILSAPLHDGMRIRMGDTALAIRSLGRRTSIALDRAGNLNALVARSLEMRALVAQLKQLAPSDVTILIEGETGSGKELVAEAVHRGSARRAGPFVVFDCGTVSRELAAAELFGHERGAYTGATDDRPGLLEGAEGGTLFIDEVGELSPDVQTMLLGAIERKQSRRVGSQRMRTHDIRVVAATNRNLAEAVRAGEFRRDLFYRLSVARLRVPPLRDRREDLPVLIDQFARDLGVVMAAGLRAPLLAYSWPGNVRELRNTIAHMAARSDPEAALPGAEVDTIFEAGFELRALPEARRLANEDFERRYLARALARTGGNVTRAAELAGISLRVMQALVAKHDIRLKDRE